MRIVFDIIKGENGEPEFVVVPYVDFVKLYAKEKGLTQYDQTLHVSDSKGLVPLEVVSAMMQGATPMKAWREYLHLTQAEIAVRLKMTQAAVAQLENLVNLRKSTLCRIAEALDISFEQLNF